MGYYNKSNSIYWEVGEISCVACPGGVKKNVFATDIEKAIVNQICDTTCPLGTLNLSSDQKTNWDFNPEQCDSCQPNYYSDNFVPGLGSLGVCYKCPSLKDTSKDQNNGKVDEPKPIQGKDAKSSYVCGNKCFEGTVIEDGETDVFKSSLAECVKCKPGYYYDNKEGEFQSGIEPFAKCKKCQIAKIGVKATYGKQAKYEYMCDSQCPFGSVTKEGLNQWQNLPEDCSHCDLNYFNPLVPPSSWTAGNYVSGQCQKCTEVIANPSINPGQEAVSGKQCKQSCPQNSVINDGVTEYWISSPTECIKCKPGHYNLIQAPDVWTAGDQFKGICTPCIRPKKNGGVATLGEFATRQKQCEEDLAQLYDHLLNLSFIIFVYMFV